MGDDIESRVFVFKVNLKTGESNQGDLQNILDEGYHMEFASENLRREDEVTFVMMLEKNKYAKED